MVVVVLVYQLEVLDAGLVDTAIEVEHECLHLCFSKNMSEKGQNFLLTFVPLGRLVKEEHDSFCVINLELLLYRLVFLYKIEKVENIGCFTYISRAPDCLVSIHVDHGEEDFHATRALRPQNVCLVLYDTMLAAHRLRRPCLFRV